MSSTRYLLDTNAASDIMRARSEPMMRRVGAAGASSLHVSVITEAELRYGLELRPEAVRLRSVVLAFLARVEIMPWTSDTASAYARLRFVLQNETGPIGAMDMLIAAHALAGNMVLVTRDRAFQRVNGLRYEDWTI